MLSTALLISIIGRRDHGEEITGNGCSFVAEREKERGEERRGEERRGEERSGEERRENYHSK